MSFARTSSFSDNSFTVMPSDIVIVRVTGGGASMAAGPGDASRPKSRRGPRAPGRPIGLGGGAGLPTAGLGGAVGAPGR